MFRLARGSRRTFVRVTASALVAALALSTVRPAEARVIQTVAGAQSVKWGLIGFIPGCQVAGAVSLAWGVAGLACTIADVDPPVTAPARLVELRSLAGTEVVGELHAYQIVRIVGADAASFEYVPAMNRITFNGVAAIGPIAALSNQRELVVGVPALPATDRVEIVVTNSVGPSVPLVLRWNPVDADPRHAVADRSPGDMARALSSVTRDWFAGFEPFTASCAAFSGTELPDYAAVTASLSGYEAVLDTLDSSSLAMIDAIVLEGSLDVIGMTPASMEEFICPSPTATEPVTWGHVKTHLVEPAR